MPKRTYSLILYAFALALSLVSCHGHQDSAEYHYYFLDSSIWTPASDSDGVLVVTGYKQGSKIFGAKTARTALNSSTYNPSNIFFGRIGSMPVAIVRHEITDGLDAQEVRAVVSHEAFHALVQHDNNIYPIAFMYDEKYRISKDLLTSVLNRYQVLYEALKNNDDICSSIKMVVNSESNIRNLALGSSFVEWPAEWYMYESTLKNNKLGSYLKFREDVDKGQNALYKSGRLAMELIDQKLGRKNWQDQYINGVLPMELLSKSLKCKIEFHENRIHVTQKLRPLFRTTLLENLPKGSGILTMENGEKIISLPDGRLVPSKQFIKYGNAIRLSQNKINEQSSKSK